MLAGLISTSGVDAKYPPVPITSSIQTSPPVLESASNMSLQSPEKKYPYRRHCKSDMIQCYHSLPAIDQDSDDRFRNMQANPSLWESSRRILRAKHLGDELGLEEARRSLLSEQILNLIVFDVQATGVPRIENGKTIYPSLIQISLFHPLTGRHFTTYLTPCKPVSYEVGFLSGVYNSIDQQFPLPDLDDDCSPTKVSNIGQKIYANYSFFERPEIKERTEYYLEVEKMESSAASDSAVQEFLSGLDSTATHLVILDDLDRENGIETPVRKAPLFMHVIDDIFKFISAGEEERSTTIFMAHNCNLWGEPLLKAEFERYCSTDSLRKLVFLDSGDIYSRIYAKEQISPENFSRLLGEKRKEEFNTVSNVLTLWTNIQYVSLSIFGRSDMPFIFSKLAEELFLAKKG